MWPFKTQQLPTIHRVFDPAYFKNEEDQKTFEKQGYVIIKNVVSDEVIDDAKKTFHDLKKMEGYNVHSNFESSGNFTSVSTQQFVFQYLIKVMQKVCPPVIDFNHCEIGDGGAFFIKPNTPESILHPHQDSTVVDETKYYAVFVWMPLLDINETNGALHLIPGSHLWGNNERSQHIPWAFRKHNKLLWDKMKAIYLSKGDMICFDSSIIHASSENKSDDYRLVLCGALLPKQHQKVDFRLKGNKVLKYKVDSNYWMNGGQEENLAEYQFEAKEYKFPNPISKKNLNTLLKTVPNI